MVSEVKYAAIPLIRACHQKKSIYHVIYIIKVPYLASIAINGDGFTLQKVAYPDAQKGLPGIFYSHPRAIGVGKPQNGGFEIVYIVLNEVVPFIRKLVDAVYIYRK